MVHTSHAPTTEPTWCENKIQYNHVDTTVIHREKNCRPYMLYSLSLLSSLILLRLSGNFLSTDKATINIKPNSKRKVFFQKQYIL